mmetsp:Transcript_12011/g.34311  ORF Transcript_12011/g.34311 Transcript_12011/m.34311 type:complete len:352 (+) Transcript_12011:405-1460(+)
MASARPPRGRDELQDARGARGRRHRSDQAGHAGARRRGQFGGRPLRARGQCRRRIALGGLGQEVAPDGFGAVGGGHHRPRPAAYALAVAGWHGEALELAGRIRQGVQARGWLSAPGGHQGMVRRPPDLLRHAQRRLLRLQLRRACAPGQRQQEDGRARHVQVQSRGHQDPWQKGDVDSPGASLNPHGRCEESRRRGRGRAAGVLHVVQRGLFYGHRGPRGARGQHHGPGLVELHAEALRVAASGGHHRRGLQRLEDRHGVLEGGARLHRPVRPERQGRRALLDHGGQQGLQVADGVCRLPLVVRPRVHHRPPLRGRRGVAQGLVLLGRQAGGAEDVPLRGGAVRRFAACPL